MSKRDLRRNLQVNQPGIQGNEQVDQNGWPTPLTDPSNPLKFVVSSGSRGETKDFTAMRTSRQDDVSIPEGHSKVEGVKKEGLDIDVKVTTGNSLKN